MHIARLEYIVVLILFSSLALAADGPSVPPPPATRKAPVSETLHGVTITDPYRWLEDQDSPETRQWIDQQNAYTHSVIDKLPGRDAISERLSQLLKIDAINVPTERNGKLVYTERKADQDLYVVHLRDSSGKDETLIDPHPLSPDHTTSVSLLEFSHDGSLLAYGIRRGGADEVEVHLKDVNSKKDLTDVLPKARYFGISFLPDKSGFYYSIMLKEGPRIRFHKIGFDAQQDEEVFGEKLNATNIAAAEVTDDGKFLLIEVQHGSAADKSEVYVQDLASHGPIKPIVTDIAARFETRLGGDTAYTLTNWNAPNGKIIAIDLNDPAREKWRDVVPEAKDAIDGFTVAGGKAVVGYLHNVTSQLKVFNPDGKQAGTITLPGLGTAGNLHGRWDTNHLYYQFSSFPTPATIYRYDLAKNKTDEWARVKVPVESGNFEVKQVWYASKDKTRIPMFLVYKKGLKLNGQNPTLLTGYGGFNLSRTPEFSALAIYWAERGGVYALPNLRGGGEFGEKWHHGGMLQQKQNVFDDFISAGEWLVQNKYTSPGKLAILGGSNGGLLVGAALTQRPELFRAVICSYPLLDMVRYHQFLVARFWVPEYGSSEDPQQFKVLYVYSPYHHVKPGTKYPAVMLLTGDSDTRVAPLHARKMTALLQTSNGGQNPVMLHYDTKSGHSEGRPVTKVISDTTDELSFLFWQLGAEQEGDATSTARK